MKVEMNIKAIVNVDKYQVDDYLLIGGNIYYLKKLNSNNEEENNNLLFPKVVFYDNRGNLIPNDIYIEEYTSIRVSKVL